MPKIELILDDDDTTTDGDRKGTAALYSAIWITESAMHAMLRRRSFTIVCEIFYSIPRDSLIKKTGKGIGSFYCCFCGNMY
jgi:hypothetical protein